MKVTKHSTNISDKIQTYRDTRHLTLAYKIFKDTETKESAA
jgi:hypothetical protein